MPNSTHARSNGRETLRRYRGYAWTHPVQSVVVVAPLSLAILTLRIWTPLALSVAAEAVLLLVLPHVPAFRRRAQRAWEEQARAAAASTRAASVATISTHYRTELERLDALVSDIDARTGCNGDVDDWHGLHSTLAAYLRLAISRRAIDEAFTATRGDELARELQAVRETEGAPWTRGVVAQQRRLLSERLALWHAMRNRVDMITCELATLEQVVRYAHDACVAASVTIAPGECASSMRGIAENIRVLGEVAALRADAAGAEARTPRREPSLPPLNGPVSGWAAKVYSEEAEEVRTARAAPGASAVA